MMTLDGVMTRPTMCLGFEQTCSEEQFLFTKAMARKWF
jgi:hypothetical protein